MIQGDMREGGREGVLADNGLTGIFIFNNMSSPAAHLLLCCQSPLRVCVCKCVRDREKERCRQPITDQITDQHPKEKGGRTRLERWVAHRYLSLPISKWGVTGGV